jgi:hypothetical protein
MSLLAFALMALVSILLLVATLISEGNFKLPKLKQTGDSSLSRKSVNWLGAIAFLSAVLICLI